MKKTARLVAHLFIIVLLTLFTQIGGLFWLAALPIRAFLNRKWPDFMQKRWLERLVFPFLYLSATVAIVPFLAEKMSGRVPMPVFSNQYLKPQSLLFCLFNRHYVKPELRKAIENVAEKMAEKGTLEPLVYLDSGFPFIDGFPLFGHFSHDDGEKIDLAFCWKNEKDAPIFGNSSPIGYGSRAAIRAGEQSNEEACGSKNAFYKRAPERLMRPFWSPEKCLLDDDKTRILGQLLVEEPALKKVLLEPFLKKRWHLERRLKKSVFRAAEPRRTTIIFMCSFEFENEVDEPRLSFS